MEMCEDLSLMLIVERFHRLCHVQFPSRWPWPGVMKNFEKLTPEIGGWTSKTPFAHYASGGGDFMQSLSSF